MIKKIFLTLMPLIALLLVLPACQHRRDARTVGTGMPGNSMIWGFFVDEDGHPLAGANIELSGPALSGKRISVTDKNGRYWFYQVPAGNDYRIVVKDKRTITIDRDNLTLLAGSTLRICIRADTRGCLTMKCVPPIIDYSDTSSTTVIQYNPDIRQNEIHYK